MDFFSESLGRLKHFLRVSKDGEVADALGLKKTAFSERKKRGSFPEKELRALAQQRPDLGIDVDYVLTGKTQRERAAGQAASVAASGIEALRELQYLQQGGLREAAPAAFPLLNEREAALLASYRACTDEERNALVHMARVMANRSK